MRVCHRLLVDGGLFLLHGICSNRSLMFGDPFISRYIFPDSCPPSLKQIAGACEDLFIIEDVENLSTNYYYTLKHWWKNFADRFDMINRERLEKGKPVLDEQFFRMWEFFLLSTAGAFLARNMQVYQVFLSKDPRDYYSRV